MSWNPPQRFSPEWWVWLASGGIAFGMFSFAVLYMFGILSDPVPLLLIAIGVSVIGDLLMAAAFELIAPTKIVVGPGERIRRDQTILETATVVAGFDNSAQGSVRVRGEIWSARQFEGRELSLAKGAKLEVLDREGLTLVVRSRE